MNTRFYAASTGAILAVVIVISTVMVLAVEARSPSEQVAVVSAVAPIYPPIAVAANAGGTVETEIEVNTAGEVTSARGTGGHPLLRRAAENAARRWRFTPTINACTMRLTFVFRIMPKETTADELTTVFTPPYRVEVRHRAPEPIVHSDPPSDVRPPRQRGRRRTQ